MLECSKIRALFPLPRPGQPTGPALQTVPFPDENGNQRAAAVIGMTANLIVAVDPSLGAQGVAVAQDLLSRADADFLWLASQFGNLAVGKLTIVVAAIGGKTDGTGGAYHLGCAGTTLVVCISMANPHRTSALFLAEASEVFQAVQNKGWDCGATNGEGLSRIHSETRYPGIMDDFESASAWLDSSRPNWVDQNEGTDQDPVSNGCACLFITWLMALGYTLGQITQAGGKSLAATYAAVTGNPAVRAWPEFSNAVSQFWPAGRPSGVKSDNPWPARPQPLPPSQPPSSPSTPATPSPTLLVSCPAGLSPGTHSFVSITPMSEDEHAAMPEDAFAAAPPGRRGPGAQTSAPAPPVAKGLTLQQILTLGQDILAALEKAGILGAGAPPTQPKGNP